ncbi:MAG: nucleoside hydrolase [Chloroflexi bacterium]|nr:nucleoside hydrolase [Chloroflexota bacterium]MCC6891602.1 nucleoside hydrolase [Anaerolineae bacterium]
MPPQKIIIDTDPGIDDSMAIFFALNSPELEVIGLTAVFGNVHVDLAVTNALRLLEIAGRTDIPVAEGAANPLAGTYTNPPTFIHGDDGQGNIHLPPPTTTAITQTAAEFIVEQIMSAPGEITLVPIGPLTNIALALRLEPRIAQNVKQVVLMGGNALVPGNATPAAEANIHDDPEAADVVFGADWSVTMVGLDVTTKASMTEQHLQRYAQSSSPMAQHIARINPLYHDFSKRVNGVSGLLVHDSTAIAYLLMPDAFTVKQWPIRVETQGFSRGKTWPYLRPNPNAVAWHNRSAVNVCTGIDSARTIELELNRVAPP